MKTSVKIMLAGLTCVFVSCERESVPAEPRPIPLRDTIITTVAGNGTFGFSGDNGLATTAQLSTSVRYVASDAIGNIYISDAGNNRIRKVDMAGIITTIAGTGTAGFSGDGGLATTAKINGPAGITIDSDGNLFFADRGNQRIRKINTAGIITTVAGKGNFFVINNGDDSLATKAVFNLPAKVAFDAAGNMYIADEGHNSIRKRILICCRRAFSRTI